MMILQRVKELAVLDQRGYDMSDRLDYLKRKQAYIEERIEEYQAVLKEYQRNRQKTANMIKELEDKLKGE